MKVAYVDSMGLPNGFRVLQYEDAEIAKIAKLVSNPEQLTALTDIINKYCRQKDALVDGRDDLLTALQQDLSFKLKTKVVKEDGEDVEVPAEKPAQYLERFVTAVMKGEFKHARFKVDAAANDEQKEAAVYTALQTLADECGDTDAEGKSIGRDEKTGRLLTKGFAYRLDITRPERKASKPKTPPKYAIEGATSIINAKNEKVWLDRFTKGYTDPNGIVIDTISYLPFDSKAPADSKPEDVERVRNTNITNLAYAIVAKVEQVRAKTAKKEFV
jgi:hypothetical protein